MSFTIAPPLPTRISFCDSVSTRIDAVTVFSSIDSTSTESACGTSSRVSPSAFSRIELGDLHLDGEVAPLLRREVVRALRQQRDELVAQRGDPVAGLRAHRVERAEVVDPVGRGVVGLEPLPGGESLRPGGELGRAGHLLRDVRRLEPVDLVERDDDRHAEREHACDAMKRSPPPIRSRAERTKSTASTSSNDASTVFCIRSVSSSSGRWKPGRSASTSCQSSPFAIPKIRRRVVCGLSETIATFPPQSALTSVDLPTFGRPATATNPDLTREDPRCPGEDRRPRTRRPSRRRAGSRRGRTATRGSTAGSRRTATP